MSKAKSSKRPTQHRSEALLTLLESLPGALFIIDDASIIVYANASAQSIIGVSPGTFVGNNFWHSTPRLVSPALYQATQKCKQTREPIEVEYVSPVTQIWLHVQISPTVGGLLMQFHEKREAQPHRETFSPDEHLAVDILKNIYIGIGFLTPEGILLDINEAPLADAQIQREQVIGKPFAETPWWSFSSTSQDLLRAAIVRASEGETVNFETLISPRDGMDIHLEVTIIPHKSMDDCVEYLVFVGTDITKRKCAEANIHTLIDAIPQLVWTGRPDGYVDYYNQRWRDYTGLSTEEAQGDGWMRCTHPEDRQRVLETWQCAVQTGRPYEAEQRLRHCTTGEYRWFLMQATPYTDSWGAILKYIGTCTDIEDKKRAEQQLKESEKHWRVLAETVPQMVWTTRPDGQHEYVNQRWCDYMGITVEYMQSNRWAPLSFIHPDDQAGTRALWQHALDTGEMYEHEERFRSIQTGEYRWFLARAMPVRNDAGQIVKWFGTITDIDEQKRVEQQLKESEKHWRVLAETMPHLVWAVRLDGRLEYTNQRAHDFIGSLPDYMLSEKWRQYLHPEDYELVQTVRRRALETGTPYEIEYRLKEGQTGAYRWFLGRALPVRNDSGHIVKWLGTSTDIEEQKRTEEALRQSQERANALMNSNIIGIFVGVGGQVVDANDTFLHMTGYTQEDLSAGHISWSHMTPPEYLARTIEAQQELNARQSTTPYEKEYICKDGSRLPVLVGAVLLRHHPFQAVTFVLDNSARKELEQRKDDFISMASHELRNPLTALKLQITLLHRQLTKQGIQTAALASMETQANKVARLVEELLDVSKIQAGGLEYVRELVDLDMLVREIAETMRHTNPSHHILVHGIVGTNLLADRDRLGQVFTNLLSNAIKYSPGAKTVEMDLSATSETIRIRIQDHGLGITSEQRNKIFDRFYRVNDSRQKAIPGLGMGLYIVAEIVKHHRGTITVESKVGKGSTFTVTLPKGIDV
ncbi:PAS domain S-box protein [Ktedonospora formicarum]|uniref:histidine kinase n=1 Tax=Ktedonospora formicarum TaxID=2778364 RepID=A0A8J3MQM2_9CHLR|nr:PAS domain S-box protein [Ktedonospora formicarum]GHO45057.1 hypothetical protein KSX_32200 [Ktedonospora formicarum]